jgi:hypothetical protein
MAECHRHGRLRHRPTAAAVAYRVDSLSPARGISRVVERHRAVCRRFAEISWYVVPGRQSIPTASGEKVGLWFGSASGSAIVLAGDWMHSELVVRHEILHHLLKDVEHPDTYFKDRCHLTWDTYWGVSSRDTG